MLQLVRKLFYLFVVIDSGFKLINRDEHGGGGGRVGVPVRVMEHQTAANCNA